MLGDHLEQEVRRYWLPQETPYTHNGAMIGHCRNHHDGNARKRRRLLEDFDELCTRQDGHHEIEQDQARRRVIEKVVERLLPVRGLNDVVSLRYEQLSDELANVRIVFDEKN